jgi:hypothetical protein
MYVRDGDPRILTCGHEKENLRAVAIVDTVDEHRLCFSTLIFVSSTQSGDSLADKVETIYDMNDM